MRNTLIGIAAFVGGAALGSVVTWKLIKDKYKKIADEEIESVKETFSKRTKKENPDRNADSDEEDQNKPYIPEKPDLMEYASRLQKEGYIDYANQEKPEKKEKEPYTRDMDNFAFDPEPYVIAPEHFGEYDDFETESLTYWANGVLTDDDGNPIIDIDGMVGADFADHFGEFEDDSVFIRNEKFKTDYEILAVLDDFEGSPDMEE